MGALFSQEISHNLIVLDILFVLHMVDILTTFGYTIVGRGETSEDIWKTFLQCWFCIYTGYQDKVTVRQRKQFTSKHW